jgi:hypothetical protein
MRGAILQLYFNYPNTPSLPSAQLKTQHRNNFTFYLYLRETGLEGVDWIHLAQDTEQWQAVVNRVMNLWVP